MVSPAARADESETKSKIRETVFYSGNVQGVGFRATTVEIARRYAIAGWVKNLDDGRVQLVAEGEKAEVEKFLAAVTKHFEKNITKQETESGKASGEFHGFERR